FENPEEQKAFKAKYGYDLPAPPVNWKEYMDVAQFFTRKKGEKLAGKVLEHDFYGNTIQGKRHVSTWYTYLNVLYSFGGQEVKVPGKGSEYGPVTVNSSEAVEALEYYMSLVPYCPPGVLTYGWDESQAAMQQSLAAMGIEWDDAVGAVENPKESLVAGKIAYSGVPIKNDKCIQVEAWSYFIPKLSRKPGLAWLFMQWAMGTERQKAQMRMGGESPIRATYDDPEVKNLPYAPAALFLKSGGQDVLGVRKVGAGNGWGIPERYLNAMNPKTGDTKVNIIPKPTFPEQEEIVDAIILAVSKALAGELSARQALDECAATAKKILGDKAK
ncbi:MAG: extracellular solute-binding protein, partial [Spirochaetota bacterium]